MHLSRSEDNAGAAAQHIRTCAICGLVLQVPPIPRRMKATCPRCGTGLLSASAINRSNARTAALALAAIILYPLAITLPIITIEQFGYQSTQSILSGIATLYRGGYWFIATIVLLCSLVFPLAKLFGLLVLSGGGLWMGHYHKAMTYHIVNWTGRWGMLDVLLVAVLVAAVKIGDLVEITAGPGAATFAAVVLLSLVATFTFNPHALWNNPLPRQRNANDYG